jgi:hypothetical protein
VVTDHQGRRHKGGVTSPSTPVLNDRSGSSTERLNLSISRLLFLKKADAGDDRLGRAHRRGAPPTTAGNAALASSRLTATPPLGPYDGWITVWRRASLDISPNPSASAGMIRSWRYFEPQNVIG